MAYEEAVAEVYDVDKFVPKAQWQRVYDVERELVEAGVDINHYARTVARLWVSWCSERKMDGLPLNVFIGRKSVQWYKEYQLFGVEVLPADRAKAVILHDEVTLALLFIRSRLAGSTVTMRYLRSVVRLSPDWHLAYEADELPTIKAAEQACGILGIECTTTDYQGIVEGLRDRKLPVE
jgi:hypothetical protein